MKKAAQQEKAEVGSKEVSETPAESAPKEKSSDQAENEKPESVKANGKEARSAVEDVEKNSDDTEEIVRELTSSSHQNQPSISVQSKMRSSSFRQASGPGVPLSPGYGFSPEGDTAPDIYRKQSLKIEELERENKRLAKDAAEGEKRWKKAEEELEELREAEDDSAQKKDIEPSGTDSVEVGKLVSIGFKKTYSI